VTTVMHDKRAEFRRNWMWRDDGERSWRNDSDRTVPAIQICDIPQGTPTLDYVFQVITAFKQEKAGVANCPAQ
jgi:hypothetical protein